MRELRRTAEAERLCRRMIGVELKRHHRDDCQIDEPADDNRHRHGDGRSHRLPQKQALALLLEKYFAEQPDHENRCGIRRNALIDGEGRDV